ncbi:MAG: hypothetical protein J7L15_03775 [Clostridiales bacterium]|nr:hypothetical protein [Clostridiales bacterium]
MERKDVLGIPIKLDDLVAYSSSNNANIITGVVIGFTPRKIKILNQYNNTLNKFSHQLVSIQANKEVYPEYYL